MIQIQNSGPIIVCDICGKQITDAKMASAVMPDSKKYPSGNGRVLHVHKENCQAKVDIQEGTSVNWDELTRHIRQLITNVKLTLTELEKEDQEDRYFGV